MRKQSRFFSMLAVAFLMIFITGCSMPKLFKSQPQMIIPAMTEPIKSEKVAGVDIYWDATSSMQGYAVPSGQTVYRTLPDNLESVGSSIGNVAFYKFGQDVTKLEGRDQRKIISPSFYTETVTSISKVVETANPDNLSVIVSDLFENDADWANVSNKIKEKYFSRNLSVAVIGLKNPFEGRIYDVGFENENTAFNYSSGMDKSKFRPFYIVVMGPHASVTSFVEKLVKNNVGNEREIVLFSLNINKKIPTLSNAELVDGKNIQRRNSSIKILDENIKEFGIGDKKNVASITAKYNYFPLLGVPDIDMSSLTAHTSVKKIVNNELVEQAEEKSLAVNVTSHFADGKIATVISFNPSKILAKDSWNIIDITINPKVDTVKLPSWVNEWNMNINGEVLTNENFNGSTTINFLKLMNSLQNAMLEISNPILGHMIMVIEG